ncbi:MAG: PAS domain S-box protein [Proteobacteria bacterium]|nr:PAS domain S-box protein [Pseudomonadota bacterium]
MKNFNDIGILYKLISINSVFVFLLLSTVFVVFYVEERNYFTEELEKSGRIISTNLAYNASLAVLTKNKDAMERYLDGVLALDNVVCASAYFPDGNLLARHVGKGFEESQKENCLSETIRRESSFFKHEGRVLETVAPVYSEVFEGGREELVMTEDIFSADKEDSVVTGYVVVGLSTAGLGVRLMDLGKDLLLIAAAFYLPGMFILALVMRLYLRPVVTVARGAERIAEGDLDIRIDVTSGDEIGVMANAFNQMVESLSKTISEVKEGAEEIENLLEGAMDGIFILDERLVIVRANREMARVLGYEKGEIIGVNFQDILMHEELNYVEEVLTKDKALIREVHLVSSTGETIPFEINFMQIVADSKIGILAFARDISERKKMEESLLNAERLAATGRLAADIAHEVNNPLGIIKNYLAISKREMEENDKDITENIDIIDEEINRIAKIIRGLLAFSRPVDDEVHLSDVNKVVEQIVELSRRSLESQKIRLDVDLNPSVKEVGLSADHLKQVLINLINNSKDAMPSGGEIVIRTVNRNDGTEIIVEDNGTGIDKDIIGKVFTPFETTKGVKGTGLGLSVSYGIVKGGGGEIVLENKKDGGVKAMLFLPYAMEGITYG